MQKTKKTLNLIALIVFLMSNFLTPISYAIDDLDIGSEVDSSSEASQSDDSTVISNDGDKSSEQEYSETPMDSDVADAPQNDDNTVISNDSEKSSEGNETSMDSHVADAPQNDEKTGENSAIDELKELIENEENSIQIIESEEIYGTGEYEGVKVEVYAQTGAFALGTILNIIPITGDDEMSDIQDVLEQQKNVEKSQKVIAFDITFLDSETEKELQPLMTGAVQVTFNYEENEELKVAEENEDQEVKVYHINDKDEDGEKVAEGEEKVETMDINEQKSAKVENGLVIDAESFSYYTIVVQIREEAPESNPTQTWQYGDDYLTINIARPSGFSSSDYPIEGFTIMDRNLGASISGTTCNTSNATGACGYLYQWGNNYGFPITANASDILTDVGLTWDDSYNNNGYVSKKFINGSSFDYDVWSDSTHHDGLWGGANDVNYSSSKNSTTKLFWDDGGDRNLRQGPCPEGWHVPSAGEWSMLLYYWYYTNYSADPSVSSNLYYFPDSTKREAFMNYFKLPFAGYRDSSDASLDLQGSYGLYWSSSPYSAGSDRARLLSLNSSLVFADNDSLRADGLSVRCFKDSYVASPESSNLVDTQAWVEGKDFETITISNPDNINEGFTIMDRNLGATATGYGASASADSYGFKYQWGNNYGFRDSDSVTAVTAGLTYNSIYDNHGYYSTNFINGSSHDYDVWDGTNPTANGKEHHDGLWGGANDSSSNNRGANQTNPTDRQGPCPVGYHVPSAGEWGLLIKYWADTKDNGTTKNATYGGSAGLYYLNSNYSAFQQKFNLPFAGYRNYSDASLSSQGSLGGYWSSSPYGSDYPYYARRLYLNSSSVGASSHSYRARGFSVRCFKDSYVAPMTYEVTFNPNGGEVEGESSLTTDNEGKVILPGATREPNENGERVFEGWFASTGVSEKIGNSGDIITPTADMDVYAHWAQTISIWDPTNPLSGFTIMDRNLGAVMTGAGPEAGTGSYGFHYQWGNNYGFDANIDPSELTTSSVKVNVSGLTSYYSGTFITTNKTGDPRRQDTWMETDNNDLWNGDQIQGPCPDGWHIPSVEELDNLLIYWAKSNNVTWSSNHVKINSGHSKISDDLYIPYAGARNYDASFLNRGNLGIFWSYSINGSNGLPYDFFTTSTSNPKETYVRNYDGRIRGISVRCFRDEYVVQCPEGEEYVESEKKCLPSRAIIRDSESGEIIQINDQEWDDLELYFLQSDGTTGHYTLMDRNMGATEVYNQNQDNPNFESLGYHYQRGNNYGFKPCEGNECSTFPGGETAGNIVIEKSVWEAYAPSKYARNTWSTAENWMGGAGNNDNLRGGAGDEKFSDGPGTGGDRQGPCPDGYHIPSAYEWFQMSNDWDNSTHFDEWGFAMKESFDIDFLTSFAGYRNFSDGKIYNRFISMYRTSSPYSNRDARKLNVNPTPGVYNTDRSDGLLVRCMRNTNKSETLRIHANGGTNAVIAFTGSVSNGRFTSLWVPIKENSVFVGWYDAPVDGNKLETGSAVVPDIYARWVVNVTFNSNGGSGIPSQTINLGEYATQPTDPTRDNSEFKWWYLEDPSTAFDFEHTAITGNITLNAKWECTGGYIEKGETCVESVLVSFNTNGGTPKQSVEIEKGTKLKGNDVKYSHTSNIDDEGNSNGNYDDNLEILDVVKFPGSEKLYVNLKYATETYNDYLVVLEGEYSGGEPNMPYNFFYGDSSDELNTTGFYVDGDVVTFLFYSNDSVGYYGYYAVISDSYDKIGEDPTNEHGEFVGWYLSGSDTLFDLENTKITENTMLYAKWDCNSGYTEVDGKCVQQFTVTLNASQNGGTIDGQGTKALTVASGSTFVRSSYTGQKAGYTFVGWAETSGTTGVLTSNPVITANKELFAVFKKDLLATFIIQDLDAATKAGGSTSCTLYNLDESCSITSPTLNANEGYTALGWNTNSGDTVSSLNSDTSTGISVNATYYSITKSNDKVLHISYTKGIGVEEIGETSDSCTLTGTYNGALQATSCIVTLPEIILRSGYGTGIWTKNTDSLVTKNPGDDIELTSNDSYTASAIATVYPISYHENGGTLVGQKTSYTVEEDFTLVTPNRDSYVFEGWTGSNGDNPQKTVTVNSGTVTGPLNYYANWTPITYTIAFNGNAVNVEGTQSSIDAIYDSGDTAPESNFTRPGYTFTSWNTQSDGNGINYDTGSELKNLTNTSGDVVTLYAIWQANTDTPYTVHYYLENIDDENYTFDSTDGKAGTTDDEISIDTLKKEITGAHFEKAAVVVSNQGPEYGATTTVDNITISGDGNTEVYLFYKRNTHTVTAIAGEGVGSVSGAGTYKYGQTVTLTPGNINSCYTANSKTFTMPDNDVQETLNGVIKKFTVTLNKDSHISSVQGNGEYNCGVEVNVSATPNVGYEFVRWEKNSTQVSTQSSYTFTITESVVLNAVSKAQNGITYTVRHWIRDIGANTYAKYSEESKSGETDSPITLENEKISVPCGTYAEGKENGTVKTTTTIKGDGSTVIDLYYGRNSYTVTTSKDSGIQSISNSASHECGADVTITATPKTGYSFARWNSEDVASSTSNLYTFTMPDKAVSIQAQSNANTYTVNFNANGGIGTMSQQTFTYDISQQLSDNLFTRTGYIFTGWSIDSGATVPTYTNKQSVDNLATTGSITLYAIWTTKGTSTKYTVRHIKQGLSTPTDDVVETQELYAETNSVQTPAVNIYFGFNSPSAGNITVSANGNASIDYVYTRKNITLTLDKDNGTQNSTITGKYGANVQKPTSNPSKSGYTFAGWLPNIPDTFPVINGTHVAQYTLDTYTITYNLNGGINHADNPTSYTYLSGDITLKAPTRDGYVFNGWMGTDVNSVTKTVIISTHSEGNRSYTAIWGEDRNNNGVDDDSEQKYTVTINYVYSRGGTAASSVSGMYLSGIGFSFTSPVIQNYTPNSGTVTGTGKEEAQTFTVTYTPNHDTNGNGIADEDETSPTPSGGGSSGGGGGGGGGGNKWNPKTQEKDIHGSADVNVDPIGDEGEKSEDTNSQDSNSSTNNVDGQNKSDSADSSNKDNSSQNGYSEEFNQAYSFAYSKGITTVSTIKAANLNSPLTRIQMAKMLSYFAINVLGKDPDTTKKVKFRDVSVAKDKQYDNGVTLAYQLGIMGINMKNDKFRPNDAVTRAEFVTALSRLLYNMSDGEYKGTSKYYEPHMKKLYNEGIITKTNPKMGENRGYVMIMLMRSAKGSVK